MKIVGGTRRQTSGTPWKKNFESPNSLCLNWGRADLPPKPWGNILNVFFYSLSYMIQNSESFLTPNNYLLRIFEAFIEPHWPAQSKNNFSKGIFQILSSIRYWDKRQRKFSSDQIDKICKSWKSCLNKLSLLLLDKNNSLMYIWYNC